MQWKTLDGNEAVADVAYRLNEVIAIYPITPASPMGEWSDSWMSSQRQNIWGQSPAVVELQSEAGAAGTLHGALQAGALTTTFTASQGLLLMLPNLYKIAGELTPSVIHVAARSLAAQALSIFGDHADVMAARGTGFALLASNSVQEAHDFALLAQAASLQSRIPFLHFFDGFRTSHEIAKIEILDDEILHALIQPEWIQAHRKRALNPEHPVLRGTAQNPDVYFQGRESVNPYYPACAQNLQALMKQFAQLTGRQYHLYEYHGAEDAERVVIVMGSGAEAVENTLHHLNARGEKVGLLKVRLYRPFMAADFVQALPASVQRIAVLDRTKEPGSEGEPLYLDVVSALHQAHAQGNLTQMPRVIGGRYGLSSKEFTPAMIAGIFEHLKGDTLKHPFTIGIQDDVSHLSLDYDPNFALDSGELFQALFYGLGSDGTVGANKNSIKIIGEHTDHFAQGYFVYDSKKSGAMTVSHLRFGPDKIQAPYLIDKAQFVACHQEVFLERFDVLEHLQQGGVFLLNSPHSPTELWEHLPRSLQQSLLEKQAQVYVINADEVARESGMRGRINTVMQTCFFAISGVLPRDQALEAIREAIRKSYGKKGQEVVEMNLRAVDNSLNHLYEVPLHDQVTSEWVLPQAISEEAPAFVRDVLGMIIAGQGDQLPVSALPADGTYPTATTRWEKRNLASEIPVWDPEVCIQCAKCALVCPHGVIRIKAYDHEHLDKAPASFKHTAAKDRDWQDLAYTIQVAPEDCTGCALCVDVCPARNKSQARKKAINMQAQAPLRAQERENWNFFLELPELERARINPGRIRQQQIQEPLFEFSGACAGCGETPYLKLLTQLFGDRMIVANATGCSSIYGGNLPTTPWSKNREGRGPAWANSLFEDNAEFGFGMRVALDQQQASARELLKQLASEIGAPLAQDILDNAQEDEAAIFEQRQAVSQLKVQLARLNQPAARQLSELADALVKKSLWIVGGDGWAYDIGYGGLDHVLASGRNVNVLVMDTEVYSNTGGQMSKATPLGAVAKFAAGGKPAGKKDLGMMAMSYGHIYVAQVAMGAKDEHTLKAFLEAEAYDGPSLIIAYSHCIAHGIPMNTAMQEHKAAVNTGAWSLYRYDPRRTAQGEAPLQLDNKAPKVPIKSYFERQNRFRMLFKSHPEAAQKLMKQAQEQVLQQREHYEHLASTPKENKHD